MKVEKGGGSGELLGEDEVLERDGKAGLGVEPAVGYNGDVVVGWDGLEHGDSERETVFVLAISLTKGESVMEENNFTVDILNSDPERFHIAVDLGIPLEVGHDSHVDTQERPSDRLDVGR